MGPLAWLLCSLAAKHKETDAHFAQVGAAYHKLTGQQLQTEHLHSTLGRVIGRTVHCCVLKDTLAQQWQALVTNIGNGDHQTFIKPDLSPDTEFRGVGFGEMPRGMLSHWIVFKTAKSPTIRRWFPPPGTPGRATSRASPGLMSSRWWERR